MSPFFLCSACTTQAPVEEPVSTETVAAPAPHLPKERPPPRPGEREPVGEASEAPKSVLLISWDTVRADRLGTYGGRAETPHLDALAARGVRFDRAISHYPETAVSHWSLLTGVEPVVHGDVPGTGGSRYRGPTFAEIAAAEGYATGAFIGGMTLTRGATGLDRGFSVYDDFYAWSPDALKRPGTEVAFRAADWIAGQEGPVFAFVHLFDAHAPYQPPPPWDTRYTDGYAGPMDGSEAALRPYRDEGAAIGEAELAQAVALYDGELAFLDSLLPQLLDAVGDDAIVALTADHGESFEHGYLFNHREALWDSTVRVPLVLAGPGVPEGVVVDRQVALTDVMPTLLELAGLPGEAKITGTTLVPVVAGEGGRDAVWSITDPCLPGARVALRRPNDKTIWHEGGRVEAYDLAADPDELRDRGAAAEGADLAAYRRFEQAMASRMREPLPRLTLPGETIEHLQALGYVGEAAPCGVGR